VKWEAPQALPPGRHTVVFDFAIDPQGQTPFGHGGTGVFSVNGQEVQRRTLPHTTPITYAWDETFDVWMDTGTPVDDRDYQVPFNFTERNAKITFDVGEPVLTPEVMIRFPNEILARARDAERPAPGIAPAAAPAAQPPRR
jgi:hypothetical protein